MVITFSIPASNRPVSLNLPLFSDVCRNGLDGFITAECNDDPLELFRLGTASGTYGPFTLFRSKPMLKVRQFKVMILLNDKRVENR